MIGVIIAEYNPLHNGHIYHINQTKQILNQLAPNEDNSIIAIMSGNFTERGDIAIVNKYTRAKHAIMAGIDMVIELPSIYATSSAEYFANGAMQVAKKIKNLGLICFGAECEDISTLAEIAKITTSLEYNNLIKQYISKGLSYPKSSELAMQNPTKIDTKIANMPNNLLGIEYIKQAKKLNLNAKLVSIKRIGGGYNETKLNSQFNSAKCIRDTIKNNENYNFDTLKIPEYVYNDIVKSRIDYDKLFAIIANNCLQMNNVYEDNEGIINRIKKYSQIANNYEELVELSHTKRYTKSKIRRVLLHIALKHTQDCLLPIGKPNVLAIKENKKYLLSALNFDGDSISIEQNKYANIIYNILSEDKIATDNMIIVQ